MKQLREHFFVPFARESRGQHRNEVLHLYQYDPVDDYYGLPDWFASFMAQGLDRTIMEYNVRLFANSLMAHLAIVVTGGRLSTNGRDAVKQFVQERMLGVKNAGRVLLMEDENDRVEIKFEKLNLDVKDLMTTKPFEFFRDVTVASHGVPPRMLGIVAAGSLGGTGEMENQLRAFRETVLRPNKLKMEKVMRLVLDQIAPGSWIRFREMDTTDLRADSNFFDKMLEHGVYQPDEVRAIVADFLA